MLKAFSKDFKDVHIIKLEQNYRSTNKILSAANTVIQNNSDRLGKNLWTESLEGDNLTLYAAFNEQEEGLDLLHRHPKTGWMVVKLL